MARSEWHENVEGRDLLEIVKYYCELIRQHCRVTEEMENLMLAAKTMAQAVVYLKGATTRKQELARKDLHDECARIASYLLHKACKGFADGEVGRLSCITESLHCK